MNIFSVLKLGEFHTNFCEDFTFHQSIHKNWLIAAVMDGCSSGQDSHFSATLFAKILKKICKEIPYWELQDASLNLDIVQHQYLGKCILEQFFKTIKDSKNNLALEVQELVSTCILLVYNIPNKSAWINCSGDGLLTVNHDAIAINQNDKPNYLAYHLNSAFQDWFEEQTSSYYFEQAADVSISTDGIFSFARNTTEEVANMQPLEYLLFDTSFQEQANMLSKKCIYLEKEYQLKPNDDVGIIRIINT